MKYFRIIYLNFTFIFSALLLELQLFGCWTTIFSYISSFSYCIFCFFLIFHVFCSILCKTSSILFFQTLFNYTFLLVCFLFLRALFCCQMFLFKKKSLLLLSYLVYYLISLWINEGFLFLFFFLLPDLCFLKLLFSVHLDSTFLPRSCPQTQVTHDYYQLIGISGALQN